MLPAINSNTGNKVRNSLSTLYSYLLMYGSGALSLGHSLGTCTVQDGGQWEVVGC